MSEIVSQDVSEAESQDVSEAEREAESEVVSEAVSEAESEGTTGSGRKRKEKKGKKPLLSTLTVISAMATLLQNNYTSSSLKVLLGNTIIALPRDSRSPDGRHHNRKKKKKEDKERDK